jgi:hypothetical protein
LLSCCTSFSKKFCALEALSDEIVRTLDYQNIGITIEDFKNYFPTNNPRGISPSSLHLIYYFRIPYFFPVALEKLKQILHTNSNPLSSDLLLALIRSPKKQYCVQFVPELTTVIKDYFASVDKVCTFEDLKRHCIFLMKLENGLELIVDKTDLKAKCRDWIQNDSSLGDERNKKDAYSLICIYLANKDSKIQLYANWVSEALLNLSQSHTFNSLEWHIFSKWIYFISGKKTLQENEIQLLKAVSFLELTPSTFPCDFSVRATYLQLIYPFQYEIDRKFVLHLLGATYERNNYEEVILLGRCRICFQEWDKEKIKYFPEKEKKWIFHIFSLCLFDQHTQEPKYAEAGWWKIPRDVVFLILKECYPWSDHVRIFKRNLPPTVFYSILKTWGIYTLSRSSHLVLLGITKDEWSLINKS